MCSELGWNITEFQEPWLKHTVLKTHVLQGDSGAQGELRTSQKCQAPEQIKEMNRLGKYYCWFPKTSWNAVATWGAQRGRETTLTAIQRNLDVSKRQSSSLKIQTVNEHRWLRPSHYAGTCCDHLWAGRLGKAIPADNAPCSLFFSCFSQTWDCIYQPGPCRQQHKFPCSPLSCSSGLSPLALSDFFAAWCGRDPGRNPQNGSLASHKPHIQPSFLGRIPCVVPFIQGEVWG